MLTRIFGLFLSKNVLCVTIMWFLLVSWNPCSDSVWGVRFLGQVVKTVFFVAKTPKNWLIIESSFHGIAWFIFFCFSCCLVILYFSCLFWLFCFFVCFLFLFPFFVARTREPVSFFLKQGMSAYFSVSPFCFSLFFWLPLFTLSVSIYLFFFIVFFLPCLLSFFLLSFFVFVSFLLCLVSLPFFLEKTKAQILNLKGFCHQSFLLFFFFFSVLLCLSNLFF